MPLSITRQLRIAPVIEALEGVEGVVVQTDDYDSTAINIFVWLNESNGHRMRRVKPTAFKIGIREAKTAIRRACREAGFDFSFLDWPVRVYEYSYHRGQRERVGSYYDIDHIKFELFA